jgi:hypothetical protein
VSLAIEEQWYVIWPLLFLGLFRLTKGRLTRLAGITAGLALGSVLLMAALHDPNRDPSRVYYGTDTRAQALLIGAVMAFLWAWRPPGATRIARVVLNLLGVAGIAYLAWAMLTMNDGTRSLYTGGFSLVALASAAVIAAAMTPGPIRWGLGLKPLAAIGIISYGLYLWHWPIYVFLSAERTGVHERALLVLRLAVTFAVAAASYFLLERPVRRQQWSWVRRPSTWIPAGAVVVVACTLFATAPILPAQSEAAAAGLTEDQLARYAKAVKHTERPPDDKTRVLVAGDSVAFTLGFWGLPRSQSQDLWLAGAAILGCGIARGTLISDGVRQPQPKACAEWPKRYAHRVRSRDPDVAMLLVGAWEIYDRVVHGKTIKFGTKAMARQLDRDLDEARAVLTGGGAHLVLLTTPCYSPEKQEFNTWGEQERSEGWRVDWLNRVFQRYADAHPDVSVVDLHGEVCPDGKYAAKIDGREVRSDGVHFAKQGTRLVWDWLAPIIQQLAFAHPHQRRITGPTTTTTTAPAAPPPVAAASGSG